jgi:transposase-like protein
MASVITKTREIEDAKKAFKKSKEVGNKKPRLMVTDGLPSCKKAFNAEFYDHHQSCKHIADVALQESLNNVLERMHGSIREREKIMRGIKVDDTPIIPMNQIYYNFVRPHMGLNGATPAEAAGIGIDGENRWMELLRLGIKRLGD